MSFFSRSMVNFIELSNSRMSVVSSFYLSCSAVQEAVVKLMKCRKVIQNQFCFCLEHWWFYVKRCLPELKYSTLEAVFWILEWKPCSICCTHKWFKCWIRSITTVVFIVDVLWSGNFLLLPGSLFVERRPDVLPQLVLHFSKRAFEWTLLFEFRFSP